MELKLTPEIAPLVTTESSVTKVVSMMDQVLLTPVKSKTVRIDSKKNLLIATFDWWSIIRYAQSGSTPLTLQSDLSDGRIAQAKLTMESEWKLD